MPLEPTPRVEQVQVLPLDAIVASPLNARSSANTERLGELADSMRTSGLQQPVVVRRRSAGSDVPYELVFGHRRTMAARSLGWTTIPAIVRDMTNEQVVLAQAVENLQREDLSPMDEARGYRQLLDELKLPVDDVVPLVGRSRTQIYARLKLLELSGDAQAAVHEGRLAAEIGQLLARQPKQLHASLLEDILEGDYEGEALSYREAKRMLAQHHAPLKNARFDRTDPLYHLQKVAGALEGDIRVTACADCPMRSGNQDDFDPANEEAEICFDTDCFRAKERAHAERAKVALSAKGAKVMKDSWSAREKLRVGELIDLDKKDPAIDKKRTLREVLGDQLGGAQIVDYDGVKVAMTPRALETALKKAGVEKASSLVAKADDKPAKKDKGESEWDRQARLSKAFEETAAAAIVPLVLAQGPLHGDLADVVKVVAHDIGNASDVLKAMGVKVKEDRGRWLEHETAAIETLDDQQLAKFLILLVVLSGIDNMYRDTPDASTKAICARYGVDLAAIRAEVYGAAPAEQQPKKGKK